MNNSNSTHSTNPAQLLLPFMYDPGFLPKSSRHQKSILFNGKAYSFSEASRVIGVSRGVVQQRMKLVREGKITIERAFDPKPLPVGNPNHCGCGKFRSPKAFQQIY